jgi:hypothetical protein
MSFKFRLTKFTSNRVFSVAKSTYKYKLQSVITRRQINGNHFSL